MITLLFLLFSVARADSTTVLSPVVVDGLPAEVLNEDPVLPSRAAPTLRNAGTGAVDRSLQDALPFTVFSSGQPGASSQLLGLGRSSEDTEVQALGIPLNYPQGGGFDLSSFPQYLWAGYRYQLGPSAAAFDPRAVSGVLTLTPYTQQQISEAGDERRLGAQAFYSSADLGQFAASYRGGRDLAVIAGASVGDARGPAGGLSGRWSLQGVKGKYHLLASYLDAATPGSLSFPTPNARQITSRVIPVVQADVPFAVVGLWKSSLYFDSLNIRYYPGSSDPFNPASSDQIRQLGLENAVLINEWRFGLSVRHGLLRQVVFEAPAETVLNAQASRSIELGEFLLEPNVQLIYVTGFTPIPTGTVGARRELLGEDLAAFARVGYSRKFPSLVSRFYQTSFFTGNPDLKPENVLSGVVGIDSRSKRHLASLELVAQNRRDAQVLVGATTPYNTGDANVLSLAQQASYRPGDGDLTLNEGITFAHSELTTTGKPFPYLPEIAGVAGFAYGPERWGAGAQLRLSGPFDGSTRRLPGYVYADLFARYRVSAGFELSARLENATDRIFETVEDYPVIGRVGSVNLVATF